jgi:Zn ribbon nucleic-acid-binding protein
VEFAIIQGQGLQVPGIDLRLYAPAGQQGQSVPSELGTRVNKTAAKKPDAKQQTVQFFPNPKLKKPLQ